VLFLLSPTSSVSKAERRRSCRPHINPPQPAWGVQNKHIQQAVVNRSARSGPVSHGQDSATSVRILSEAGVSCNTMVGLLTPQVGPTAPQQSLTIWSIRRVFARSPRDRLVKDPSSDPVGAPRTAGARRGGGWVHRVVRSAKLLTVLKVAVPGATSCARAAASDNG